MRAEQRSARVIPQPIPGAALHKLLNKRLRIPNRVVHPLLRAIKCAAHPAQYELRRRVAAELIASARPAGEIVYSKGYRLFGPDGLPGIRNTVARCREIFQAIREALPPDDFLRNPRKQFLLSILAGADFCQYPELINFMISRPLLDRVTVYLGSVPLLAGANLWWSPVNDTARSSQLFHVDTEDARQLKVFINITDTAEDQGPFTFLPADVSDRIMKSTWYDIRRYKDEHVEKAGCKGRELKLVGPAGSGAFVDTARCLHYGSRSNRRDRIVLSIQYLRFHAPCEATMPLKVPSDLAGIDPDPVQKLTLGFK